MSPAPLSRRSLFAAGSALAVTAALPAIAEAAPVAILPDPVIALALDVERLYAADLATYKVYSPLDDAHVDWLRKNPMPQFTLPQQAHFSRCIVTGATIVEDLVEIDISPEQRAAEKRALANWKRRERRWRIKSGYDAAEEASAETSDRLMDALDALADAVPTTVAGLIAKARAALTVGDVIANDRITTFPRDIAALAPAFGEA